MRSVLTHLNNRSAALPFVIIRIGLGISFFLSGWDKFSRESYAKSMTFIFNVHWKDKAYDFYQVFLDVLVMPNLEFWAFVVTWGEFAIGLAFIFGFFTRAAALGAMFLLINIILASGGLSFFRNADVGFLLGSLALFLVCAGRYFGIDALLAERSRQPTNWKHLLY